MSDLDMARAVLRDIESKPSGSVSEAEASAGWSRLVGMSNRYPETSAESVLFRAAAHALLGKAGLGLRVAWEVTDWRAVPETLLELRHGPTFDLAWKAALSGGVEVPGVRFSSHLKKISQC